MILNQSTFHKDFQLNGISFSSVNELLSYSLSLSKSTQQFFKKWFSNDDFIIVKTSGSTGTPKSIKLKKELIINSAFATGEYFSLQENTTALLCLPTEYIAGKMMLVRAIILGWHLDIIKSDSHPLKRIVKTYDFSAMVPLQLENSIEKLSKIKKIIVGGGVVSNQLQNNLQHLSTEVFATYGMTETITHIAIKKLNNYKNSTSSVSSLSYTTSIQNSFYTTLPNITIYKDIRNCLTINAPKVSDEIIFTNDVIQLISDTQFIWLGRFDNVINSGGIKLHPEKIEVKLSKIIKNRFFVAGIPDKILGEKLVLLIEGNEHNMIFNKVKNCKLLSKFEIPKEIYFVNEFLETETKKIQRKKTLDLINL